MRLLRANTDTLMSVLESFIHDPLVEWNRKKVLGFVDFALTSRKPINLILVLRWRMREDEH